MGEYEERASELPCLVGFLPPFLLPLARNSGICIWAALLNVIIAIRLISLTRSSRRSLANTISSHLPSIHSGRFFLVETMCFSIRAH